MTGKKNYAFNGHVAYVEVSQHIFNIELEKAYNKCDVIIPDKFSELLCQPGACFRYVGNSKCKLSYKLGGQWKNYITDLYKVYDDDNYIGESPETDGGKAYGYFKRFCKIEDVDLPINQVAPYSYCNEKYVNDRYQNCVGYDMNNAYLAACDNLKVPIKLIDFERCPKENEIGFNSNGVPIYGPSERHCGFIFTCSVDEGMQRWVEFIKEKIKGGDPVGKPYYQYMVGMLTKHNIPLRNAILYKAEQTMLSLKDDNTLWSTTDSIVSLVERPDLKLTNIPGDFKIEHKGDFAYIKTGYQWNYDVPAIKGLSHGKVENYNRCHKEKFDILKKETTNIEKIKYKLKDGYIVNEQEEKL